MFSNHLDWNTIKLDYIAPLEENIKASYYLKIKQEQAQYEVLSSSNKILYELKECRETDQTIQDQYFNESIKNESTTQLKHANFSQDY